MPYYFRPATCTNYQKFATASAAFSADECERIKSLHVNPMTAGVREKGEVDEAARKSRVTWIYPTDINSWIFKRLETAAFEVNRNHWNFQLSQIDALQLTEYSEKGHYNWHEDIGEGTHAIRKLSMVVQLTDPKLYTGGDLLLYPAHQGAKSLGAITVFPSYVTHKVCPVESGTRMSLVAWVEGPSLI